MVGRKLGVEFNGNDEQVREKLLEMEERDWVEADEGGAHH